MGSLVQKLKAIQLFYFLVIILLSSSSYATLKNHRFNGFPENTSGYGLLLGEPTAVRYLLFTGWKTAWSFSLGYSFNKVAALMADRLWYFYNANDKIRDINFWNSILFYAGTGVRGGYGLPGSDTNDSYQFGIRGIGGAEYIFINSPWSIRFELAPEVFLKGKSSFDLSAGVGLTYYFFDKTTDFKSKKIDPSEFD